MSFKVTDECIGCGACDYSFPTTALTETDTFLGVFVIDLYLCDDCTICVDKCPEGAIVPDPEWSVCHGRGCPLTSQRLSDIECAVWQERCEQCGATLWRRAGGEWACSRCGMGMKVHCPKASTLEPVELRVT